METLIFIMATIILCHLKVSNKEIDRLLSAEHTFIWIIYHMTAEATASVQRVTRFHGNQINIVNEILQNLREKKI